jgi:hypothetical protein
VYLIALRHVLFPSLSLAWLGALVFLSSCFGEPPTSMLDGRGAGLRVRCIEIFVGQRWQCAQATAIATPGCLRFAQKKMR